MNKLEYHISRAEIAYKRGNTSLALREGKHALTYCDSPEKTIALKIFIAKCLSKLGDTTASNIVYRNLINEKVYLAPVISGLLYNHFSKEEIDFKKIQNSVRLMKIFVH